MKLKQLLIVLLVFGAVSALAQEFVIRDRGGDVATVTNSALDVTLGGDAATDIDAITTDVDGIATNVATLVTHAAAIETAVEDTTAVDVTSIADTTGGCLGDGSSIVAANSVNETAVKATAGQLYSVSVFSLNDAPVYLKLYNDTTANIDETDTPILRLMAPANSTATLGAGVLQANFGAVGMQFSTAITYRATKGIADNDTTALDASEVLINVCYK